MAAHLNADQRDRAMLVLALEGGHSLRAHERLTAEGIHISDRQLRNYRNDPRYQEIRKTKAAEIEAANVEHYKEATRLSLELNRAASLKALEAIEAGDIKGADLARVGQNAMVSAGIATDKALVYEGRPNVITGGQDVQGLLQRMQRFLGSTESTALEVENEAEQDSTSSALLPESAESNARD